MSATLPPAAELDRPSDFGEFWNAAAVVPRPASVMPESESVAVPMTAEQLSRRARLRRAVSGIVLGLLAFTALAACVYVVKGRATARSSNAESSKPVAAAHE